MSQAQRDEVMNRFRKRKLNVMVATDVAARGIDVNELTHVINVNIPDDPEVYVHRSGRTGRAGSSGISIVITHGRNMRKVNNLERIIGKEFEQKKVPSGEAICEIKIGQAIDELVEFEFANELDPMLLDSAMDKLAHLNKAELIERFLGHETSLILSRYRGARDINEQPKKFKEQGPRKSGGGSEEGFKTIVVDLGYRQNVNPSRLIGLINDTMEGKKIRIGKIDMDKTFTRIDVEDRFAVEVAVRLSGAKTGSYVVNAYFEEGSGSSGGASGGQRRQKRERISSGKKFRSDNRFEDRSGRGDRRRDDRDQNFRSNNDDRPRKRRDDRGGDFRGSDDSRPRHRSDRPSFDSDRSRSRGGYGGPRGENRGHSKGKPAGKRNKKY